MARIYDDFKTYEEHRNLFIVENYIRHLMFDTVIHSDNSLDSVLEYMEDNDLWDDWILLGIDSNGRAYYPEF